MTAKGVSLLFENLQRTRKQKLNQVNKIKQKVNDLFSLKITRQTVTDVETQINKFDKYCKEAEELYNSIVEMPIPQDEYDKQNKWFRANDSISNVSTKRSHHSKASKGSTTTLSSTSSARIKAMAKKLHYYNMLLLWRGDMFWRKRKRDFAYKVKDSKNKRNNS